jgi:transcriptional regulator with XRE-family HTH domain
MSGPTEADIVLCCETLGEAVRRLREFKGMTLRRLAEKVAVSAPFLSDLEHDRRNTDKLDKIAEALGVPVDYLKRFDARVPASVIRFLRKQPLLVKVIIAVMTLEESPHAD